MFAAREDDHAWRGAHGPDEESDDLDLPDDDDDDDECAPCPYCGQMILEESERCPHCEKYISREDAPPARKPLWIILGVAACLYVIYRWIVLA
jgi:hypothetical protein